MAVKQTWDQQYKQNIPGRDRIGEPSVFLEVWNDLCLKPLPSLAEKSLLHIWRHGLKGCRLMFSKLGLRLDLHLNTPHTLKVLKNLNVIWREPNLGSLPGGVLEIYVLGFPSCVSNSSLSRFQICLLLMNQWGEICGEISLRPYLVPLPSCTWPN